MKLAEFPSIKWKKTVKQIWRHLNAPNLLMLPDCKNTSKWQLYAALYSNFCKENIFIPISSGSLKSSFLHISSIFCILSLQFYPFFSFHLTYFRIINRPFNALSRSFSFANLFYIFWRILLQSWRANAFLRSIIAIEGLILLSAVFILFPSVCLRFDV